jgi:thiamine phosphate synthase YjbQ (UPF0047 family)
MTMTARTIRATETIPFVDGRLTLGTWQQIVRLLLRRSTT